MTRRQAIKLLKTERTIQALDARTYYTLLALKAEIGRKDLTVELAHVKPPHGSDLQPSDLQPNTAKKRQ